jgi:hypothetical protein
MYKPKSALPGYEFFVWFITEFHSAPRKAEAQLVEAVRY